MPYRLAFAVFFLAQIASQPFAFQSRTSGSFSGDAIALIVVGIAALAHCLWLRHRGVSYQSGKLFASASSGILLALLVWWAYYLLQIVHPTARDTDWLLSLIVTSIQSLFALSATGLSFLLFHLFAPRVAE